MEVMGVVAVMVNLALLGMGGSVQRMFPNMTVTDRIILIVVLEVSFLSMFSLLLRSRGTKERLLILFRRRQKARIFGLQIGRPCKVFQGF